MAILPDENIAQKHEEQHCFSEKQAGISMAAVCYYTRNCPSAHFKGTASFSVKKGGFT